MRLRAPAVVTASICRTALSERHHPRTQFIDALEESRVANMQFLPPGPPLDAALEAINSLPEGQFDERMAATDLPYRRARTNAAPVFDDAFLVYETRLFTPLRGDYDERIAKSSYGDIGSHRMYFLKATCIRLREDLADGAAQIGWNGLPGWPRRGGRGGSGEPPAWAGPLARFQPVLKVRFQRAGVAEGLAYRQMTAIVHP